MFPRSRVSPRPYSPGEHGLHHLCVSSHLDALDVPERFSDKCDALVFGAEQCHRHAADTTGHDGSDGRDDEDHSQTREEGDLELIRYIATEKERGSICKMLMEGKVHQVGHIIWSIKWSHNMETYALCCHLSITRRTDIYGSAHLNIQKDDRESDLKGQDPEVVKGRYGVRDTLHVHLHHIAELAVGESESRPRV